MVQSKFCIQNKSSLQTQLLFEKTPLRQGVPLYQYTLIRVEKYFQNYLEFSSNVSFADDTNVFLSGRNIQSLYDKGNKELSNIDNWMLANKLTVNVKKTNVFYSKLAILVNLGKQRKQVN